MRKIRSAILVGTLVVSAACSGTTSSPGTDAPATSSAGAFPVTLGDAGHEITLAQRPEAIVSLSPTATEMLFSIGAGDQVIAADQYSDYPRQAPTTDLNGFDPNVEAIVAYGPDLVVMQDASPGIVHGLGSLDIPVLLEPAAVRLDDSYQQMEELGLATGHGEEAATAVEGMRADIDAALAAAPNAAGMRVYHELDDTYYSATSDTFIGQIYAAFGMVNIADQAKGAATGYPQLSAEYIVQSDPDLIVLADGKCCGQSAATVGAREGWSGIRAVRDDAVIAIDDDVASRWGPRVVEFIQAVSRAVQGVQG